MLPFFFLKNQYSCPQKKKVNFQLSPSFMGQTSKHRITGCMTDEPYQSTPYSVLSQLASASCSFSGKCIQYHHHSDHRPENSSQIGSGFLPYRS